MSNISAVIKIFNYKGVPIEIQDIIFEYLGRPVNPVLMLDFPCENCVPSIRDTKYTFEKIYLSPIDYNNQLIKKFKNTANTTKIRVYARRLGLRFGVLKLVMDG
jgi:hypothetical protein